MCNKKILFKKYIKYVKQVNKKGIVFAQWKTEVATLELLFFNNSSSGQGGKISP